MKYEMAMLLILYFMGFCYYLFVLPYARDNQFSGENMFHILVVSLHFVFTSGRIAFLG